jgi:opacity protein-like surface antigen
MKTLPIVVVLSLATAVPLAAQDEPVSLADDLDVTLAEPTSSVPDSSAVADLLQQEERERERELGRPGRISDRELFHLGIGPQAGFFKTKGADSGTWFGGIQGRIWLLEILGVEAAITFHSNELEDGDVRMTQFPVQVSAILSPFGGWALRPYVIGGVGWYYTRFDFETNDRLGRDDDTDNVFGVHIGAGLEFDLTHSVGLNADVRYIWLDSDDFEDALEEVDERDFNSWQVALGMTIRF